MRKGFALLWIALVAGSFSVEAETAPRVRGGLLGGLNATDIVWSPSPDFGISSRTRASLGGLIEWELAPTVALETRVLWLQTGIGAGASAEEGFDTARISVDYISVPVLFRKTLGNARVRPFLVAGPELAFKVRTGSSLEVSGVTVEDAGLADGVSSTNFSLDVGGGFEVPAGAVGVFVEGLYSHGITTIDGDSNPESVKTRGLRLSVGLRF